MLLLSALVDLGVPMPVMGASPQCRVKWHVQLLSKTLFNNNDHISPTLQNKGELRDPLIPETRLYGGNYILLKYTHLRLS